ncbi:hypothetical protein FisN_16Lh108 [Fistulifera solaris]|uniref:Uncharacterized protein n=1 Tax=Fistulifera solaris TaxID=1519565 RepID=A0A1Z5KJ87_FISSO|nr:hypothetical protein FisN_16Lh108 [Fistulifera solaris]|eukprot:GAX26277.1 hypothetical protein FisN_16Lh108 [Fistulifera solaris]
MQYRVALLLLHAIAVMGTTEPYGIQMGPAAGQGTFASSFVKDPTSGRLLLTGSSYDTGKSMSYRCFLAAVENGGFTLEHTYGHSAVDGADPISTSQACSHLMLHENRIFIAGHSGSDTTGNLEALYNRGAVLRNYRYGFIMDLMRNKDEASKFDLLGGLVLQQAAAVYPISTTTSPSDNNIYIASMKTDQSTPNGDGLPAMDPNLVLPVGKTYGLILESYGIQDVVPTGNITKTLVQKHRAFYEPGDGGSVYVAGMLKINDDTLIVAGHTYGQGRGFGKSFSSQNILEPSESLDGFVTKFSTTGLVPSVTEENGMYSTFRVESTDHSSEFIYGMCGHGYGEHADGNHVYIVGATTGSLSVTGKGKSIQDAFIMKLQVGTNTDEMQMVWIRQLSVNEQDTAREARLFGVSCAVSPADGHVWWAGHVTNGARVHSATARASGGQDIFVEKLMDADGEVVFTKQFGSTHDDEIAWRGGLHVDGEGNALLVGNTLGPLFRQKTDVDNSDVFAMSIAPDGKMYLPFDESADSNGGHILPPVSLPEIEEQDSSQQTYVVLICVLVVLVSAVFFCMLYMRGRQNHYEATTDRAKVIGYLNAFDVEDVELKHSATGGWHCSYVNGLAQGKVKLPYSDRIRDCNTDSLQKVEDPLTRPLNSSVMSSSCTNGSRRSLFTDDYDSLFGVNNNSSRQYSRTGSSFRAEDDERGFGSLVNDYTASYSDRRREKAKKADRWGQQLV